MGDVLTARAMIFGGLGIPILKVSETGGVHFNGLRMQAL